MDDRILEVLDNLADAVESAVSAAERATFPSVQGEDANKEFNDAYDSLRKVRIILDQLDGR